MKQLCLMFAVWTTLTGVAGAGETNPYANIWGRNSFGLKAPVLPVVATPEPVKPEVKVTLTGFVTLAEQRRATFMLKVGAGAPVLFSLAEGEKNDSVEVLKIDEQKDTVTIIHAGETMKLTFDPVATAAPVAPVPPPTPPAAPPAPPKP